MCLSVIQVTCDPLNMSLSEMLILLQSPLTQCSSYLTGRRSNNWNQWRKHKGHDTCQSNRANQVWWQESATVVETWNRTGPRIWWVFIFLFFDVHEPIWINSTAFELSSGCRYLYIVMSWGILAMGAYLSRGELIHTSLAQDHICVYITVICCPPDIGNGLEDVHWRKHFEPFRGHLWLCWEFLIWP